MGSTEMRKQMGLHDTGLLNTDFCVESHGELGKKVTTALPLLLALPLEARQEIYGYFVQASIVEDRNGPQYYSEYWTFHNGYYFPSLLRTCAQIHDELAPMVYKRVRLAFDVNWQDIDTHPSEWLKSIGRNVSHIQHCEIKYQTHHYIPKPLAAILRQPDMFDIRFAFYNAICVLYEHADDLRVLDVSVGRPSLANLPQKYISPPRSANDPPPPLWRCDMNTDEDCEAMRREFFPEIAYTLRLLKDFDWVERIVLSDPEHQHLFGPVLPCYLQGELGFDLGKISTRADERWEYREIGWTGRGPGFEHWELINPARRDVQRLDAGQSRRWRLTWNQERDKEVRAQPPAW